MSEARVNNLSNESNTGGPTISGITTFSGTNFFVPPVGNTAQRPENPQKGAIRFNTDTKHLEYYRGDTIGWVEVEASHGQLGGGTGSNTGRGARMLYGGSVPGYTNTVDYITISTLGNSQDFGDLTVARGASSACGSSTRAVVFSGYASPGGSNVIDYATFSSTGNFIDFGDVHTDWKSDAGMVSSSTRGICGNGQNSDSSPYYNNTMDYITIAATGNSVDFGDAASSTATGRASCSSSTRGIWASHGYDTKIQSVEMATTGNMVDFGDMNTGTYYHAGASNSTRGIIVVGYTNVMEYITIATRGNATDFGDRLSPATYQQEAGTDPTRCLIAGGRYNSGGYIESNVIQYVTIATTGNSKDFGDLVCKTANNQEKSTSCTNGHGGL